MTARNNKNRMSTRPTLAGCATQIREFISAHAQTALTHGRTSAAQTETKFNQIALELFRLQFEAVPVYRRFCEARKFLPHAISGWNDIPALPVSAFKAFEISSLAPAGRVAVFHSSGTTGQPPSRHFHSVESLQIYEASVLAGFEQHLLGDR